MIEHKLFEKMFGLPEFRITDFKHNDYDMRVYVEMRHKPSVCPSCGVVDPKVRVHSSRIQEVREFPILRAKIIYFINHKIEVPRKPKYASTGFSNMMTSYASRRFSDDYEYGPKKDYGVAFGRTL